MPPSDKEGDKDVAGAIQDVLKRRIGEPRHAWWIAQDFQLIPETEQLLVLTTNRFMVDRVRRSLLEDLQQAAREVYGATIPVRVQTRIVSADDDHESSAADETPTVAPNRPSSHGLDAKDPAPKSAGPKKASRKPLTTRVSRPAHAEPQKLVVVGGGVDSDQSQQLSDGSTGKPSRSQLASTSLANFCVGSCNTLAHVAAKMVTEQPGSPSHLFFWGPSGTGKTHLLAAMRNELRDRHRLRRVVMLSAEQFTNDFTGAVRGSGLPAFRRRYRDVDALLVDDVQFVGGKRATLRELLYTVDSLIRGRCQLAFTADRPPLELEGLNEELAGRMAGGMVCPMRPLDRDTRRNVLQGLADVSGLEVETSVLDKLADELVGDGRVLSGAFNHLRTLSHMVGRPASWDELMNSAPDLIASGRPAVNLGDIQKAVCDMFGLPSGSLSSRGQHRSISEPRMLAMYLARQYTRAAYSEIGQFFGDRSHSTVIAATKRVEDWISVNKPLRRGAQTLAPRQALEAIENLIRTG
jgi:chromosomal replication initiator protein